MKRLLLRLLLLVAVQRAAQGQDEGWIYSAENIGTRIARHDSEGDGGGDSSHGNDEHVQALLGVKEVTHEVGVKGHKTGAEWRPYPVWKSTEDTGTTPTSSESSTQYSSTDNAEQHVSSIGSSSVEYHSEDHAATHSSTGSHSSTDSPTEELLSVHFMGHNPEDSTAPTVHHSTTSFPVFATTDEQAPRESNHTEEEKLLIIGHIPHDVDETAIRPTEEPTATIAPEGRPQEKLSYTVEVSKCKTTPDGKDCITSVVSETSDESGVTEHTIDSKDGQHPTELPQEEVYQSTKVTPLCHLSSMPIPTGEKLDEQKREFYLNRISQFLNCDSNNESAHKPDEKHNETSTSEETSKLNLETMSDEGKVKDIEEQIVKETSGSTKTQSKLKSEDEIKFYPHMTSEEAKIFIKNLEETSEKISGSTEHPIKSGTTEEEMTFYPHMTSEEAKILIKTLETSEKSSGSTESLMNGHHTQGEEKQHLGGTVSDQPATSTHDQEQDEKHLGSSTEQGNDAPLHEQHNEKQVYSVESLDDFIKKSDMGVHKEEEIKSQSGDEQQSSTTHDSQNPLDVDSNSDGHSTEKLRSETDGEHSEKAHKTQTESSDSKEKTHSTEESEKKKHGLSAEKDVNKNDGHDLKEVETTLKDQRHQSDEHPEVSSAGPNENSSDKTVEESSSQSELHASSDSSVQQTAGSGEHTETSVSQEIHEKQSNIESTEGKTVKQVTEFSVSQESHKPQEDTTKHNEDQKELHLNKPTLLQPKDQVTSSSSNVEHENKNVEEYHDTVSDNTEIKQHTSSESNNQEQVKEEISVSQKKIEKELLNHDDQSQQHETVSLESDQEQQKQIKLAVSALNGAGPEENDRTADSHTLPTKPIINVVTEISVHHTSGNSETKKTETNENVLSQTRKAISDYMSKPWSYVRRVFTVDK